MTTEKFEDWLKGQGLQPTSTDVYARTIRALVAAHGVNPDMKQINSFVAERADKRQAYAKYAVKHFLKYLGRENECSGLVKAKTHKPIRKRHYYTESEIGMMVKEIKKSKHKAAFYIQQLTGCRIGEVLTIQPKFVEIKQDTDSKKRRCMRITVMGKGGKPRPVFIFNEKLISWLGEWFSKFKNKEAFPFLGDDVHKLPKALRVSKLKTAYNRCLEDLQQASEKCGLGKVGTHDARRTFADKMRHMDPQKAKHAGGWSNINMLMHYWEETDSEQDTLEIARELQK